MGRLSDWYDYRIVNVNVNVIVAGIAALGITVGVLHLMDRTGALQAVTGLVEGREFSIPGLPFRFMGEKMVIGGLTFAIDLIADVLVYYALHWAANHMPRRRQVLHTRAYADLTFMRDATLVQFERALLSPILYLAALPRASRSRACCTRCGCCGPSVPRACDPRRTSWDRIGSGRIGWGQSGPVAARTCQIVRDRGMCGPRSLR
jgi:hypothetical protein